MLSFKNLQEQSEGLRRGDTANLKAEEQERMFGEGIRKAGCQDLGVYHKRFHRAVKMYFLNVRIQILFSLSNWKYQNDISKFLV